MWKGRGRRRMRRRKNPFPSLTLSHYLSFFLFLSSLPEPLSIPQNVGSGNAQARAEGRPPLASEAYFARSRTDGERSVCLAQYGARREVCRHGR